MKELPKITLPTNEKMIEVSENWWNNTHEKISVLSWNSDLKAVSAPFQLIDLNFDFIEMILSEGRVPLETQVVEFEKIISNQNIKTLNKVFFAKTISRSSKDATPDLKFTSIESLLVSLGSSMRTFEDLCLLRYIPEKAKLIIKEFTPIDKSKEFRVFVKDNKLNGITQYHYFEKYDWIIDNSGNIEDFIRDFVDK